MKSTRCFCIALILSGFIFGKSDTCFNGKYNITFKLDKLTDKRKICTALRSEYYDRFEKFYDYDYIKDQLSSGNTVNFTYQKIDGSWVELTITIYDEDSSEAQEMLWIFQDENN